MDDRLGPLRVEVLRLQALVKRLTAEVEQLRRNRWPQIAHRDFEWHRGITNMAVDKGTDDKTASRYEAGTKDDTGIDDTLVNEMADVGAGKVVYYAREPGAEGWYIFAAECPLT